MVEASSPGRVSPRIKSIDVEANLLGERIAERERLVDAMSRKAFAGLGILLFGLLVLPAAYRLQARMGKKALAAVEAEGVVARQLADRNEILKLQQPKLEDTQMLDTLHLYADNYFTQLTSLLNSASSGMVFASIKCEVLGGEMKIAAKADAESYSIARDFVAASGKSPKTKSATLKGWRRNEEFGAAGVSFDVEKTAEVGQ